ncbi:ribosomal protein S18 acetylase RimI-like enzyme [Scopulibacillus daqui]|uniref:Ribosomal protein S18 acetylase RimI-like enzyme n=2 Tax=Scopulibacillus daqui TaxID=1469162 RepID=A0ABS2PX23_9BACL|nr:GNAT family N-acetyltransferase [Scopulibacillus daqui]MBM7644609.1 ribosomal protein S18 acetylase RimI-like enzyme [Scopulibacillus daqui]
MVYSQGVFNCLNLDGFAAVDQKDIIGLITFYITESTSHIISLDSIRQNQGIGSSLLTRTEEHAKKQNCSSIQLVTTNDNLKALYFYQKRGYQCIKVLPNAVNKAREIKPEIPLFSNDGIPIRDEFILSKRLK